MKKRNKILYLCIFFGFLFLLLEIGFRFVFYTKLTDNWFSMPQLVSYLENKFKGQMVQIRKENALEYAQVWGKKYPSDQFFQQAKFQNLREKCYQQYRIIFEDFAKQCMQDDIFLMVVYFPSIQAMKYPAVQEFYSDLAEEFQVPFLDLTDAFLKENQDDVYFDWDGHLARFGNRLASEEIAKFLKPLLKKRTAKVYSERPKILGELPIFCSESRQKEFVHYAVTSNNRGFRNRHNVAFPRDQNLCRILCIGDSFTFGPYLPVMDTYPELLHQKLKNAEVFNAGRCSYTICDEYAYLHERGKYLEPDIVILQVLDNDIYGLLEYRKKLFCRGGKYCLKREQFIWN